LATEDACRFSFTMHVKLIDSAYRTSLRLVYVPSGIDSVRRFLKVHPEAEFFDVIGTITSTNGFYSPPPFPEQKWFKTVL
jgi:hypothetical protein